VAAWTLSGSFGWRRAPRARERTDAGATSAAGGVASTCKPCNARRPPDSCSRWPDTVTEVQRRPKFPPSHSGLRAPSSDCPSSMVRRRLVLVARPPQPNSERAFSRSSWPVFQVQQVADAPGRTWSRKPSQLRESRQIGARRYQEIIGRPIEDARTVSRPAAACANDRTMAGVRQSYYGS